MTDDPSPHRLAKAEWFHSTTLVPGKEAEVEVESEDELDPAWTLPWYKEVGSNHVSFDE